MPIFYYCCVCSKCPLLSLAKVGKTCPPTNSQANGSSMIEPAPKVEAAKAEAAAPQEAAVAKAIASSEVKVSKAPTVSQVHAQPPTECGSLTAEIKSNVSDATKLQQQ